jgi:hypothetical protein
MLPYSIAWVYNEKVRPQYNEPLEVLTMLIFQCFSLFNSRLKNDSATSRIFFGRKVLVRV